MFNRIAAFIALTALSSFAPACDSDKDAKSGNDKVAAKSDKAPADKADDAKAPGGGGEDAVAAGGSVTLEKLGLNAEAPAGSTVSDAIGGTGVMVQGPELVVTVQEASDSQPKTLDATKEDAEMYGPKNPKTEELPDGFIYMFENSGGAGTNYWVQARREIGGKTYWCETTAAQPEQQANAVAFCKSLAR
jgi:hypothetical protein